MHTGSQVGRYLGNIQTTEAPWNYFSTGSENMCSRFIHNQITVALQGRL